MITLSQHQLVRLVIEKINQYGTSKSGTYNKADPTHFEKGSAEFLFGGEHKVKVNYHDSTWVVTFDFETPEGKVGALFDPSPTKGENHWRSVTSDKVFKYLDLIIMADELDTESGIEAEDMTAAMGKYIT